MRRYEKNMKQIDLEDMDLLFVSTELGMAWVPEGRDYTNLGATTATRMMMLFGTWYASQNPSPKKVTKNWAHRESVASSKVEACSPPFLSPRPDWSDWLLPREQHITMEDASSLLVNSWTAMSVFLVQWSMFQTAPGSPFWIVLAQKLQFHYVSLALKPWYNWKNATKITKTGNYVEPNSMFPFSASTAATFIYSVCG